MGRALTGTNNVGFWLSNYWNMQCRVLTEHFLEKAMLGFDRALTGTSKVELW
jgi:hypothetical protein